MSPARIASLRDTAKPAWLKEYDRVASRINRGELVDPEWVLLVLEITGRSLMNLSASCKNSYVDVAGAYGGPPPEKMGAGLGTSWLLSGSDRNPVAIQTKDPLGICKSVLY